MLNVRCQLEKSTRLAFYIDEELWRMGDTTILGKNPQWPRCDVVAELEDWLKALEYAGGKRYAYKRLAMQSVHSLELTKLLMAKQVSEATCQRIIEELRQQGYLNDEEWTEAFVRGQIRKKHGPRAVLQKLQAKGVKNAELWLSPVSLPEVQQEAILRLVNSRYRARDLSNHNERNKVIAALMRKGYDLDIILATIPRKTPSSSD